MAKPIRYSGNCCKQIAVVLFLYQLPVFSIAQHRCYDQGKTDTTVSKHLNMPQTNTKVKKEYDKQGNLLRYDSVVTWQYSGVDTLWNGGPMQWDSLYLNLERGNFGDNAPFDFDSIVNSMRLWKRENHPFSGLGDTWDTLFNPMDTIDMDMSFPFGGWAAWENHFEEMMRKQREIIRQLQEDLFPNQNYIDLMGTNKRKDETI